VVGPVYSMDDLSTLPTSATPPVLIAAAVAVPAVGTSVAPFQNRVGPTAAETAGANGFPASATARSVPGLRIPGEDRRQRHASPESGDGAGLRPARVLRQHQCRDHPRVTGGGV